MNTSNNNEIIPSISVIVPVYNCQRFIRQCVESILKQTYTNIELILVDDGSKDQSSEICDQYARTESRVIVVHKKNGGVSSARNYGLEFARGRYVVFVDSDDYVNPRYIEDYSIAFQNESENFERTYILSDYIAFSETNEQYKESMSFFQARIKNGGISAEQFKKLVFDFRIFPPYCKLFNRKVIEKYHIRFDTGLKSAEDFDFNMKYLAHMDSICYIPSANYNYRVDYKKYIPSNHGVLGRSEIKSAHIMAEGIITFAKRLGLYEELQETIDTWIAKKHYYNRLPMLFAGNRQVSVKERYILYKKLINNKIYYRAAKRGVKRMKPSTTRLIGQYLDCFISWWLFFAINNYRLCNK